MSLSYKCLGKTFDIKTGEPRLLATPLTCKQSKQWYSPYAKKLLQIPDQVDFMDVSATCQEEALYSAANASTAWKMVAESWGFSISVGIPIGGSTLNIGVGFEKEVAKMAERMDNFTKSMTSLKRTMSMYRLSFGHSGTLALGGQMQLALAHLPVIVDGYAKGTPQQRSAYDNFVKAFGTHYVAGADFGAHCAFNTFLDESFESKMSSKYVSEQISISMGIQMGTIGISTDLGFGMTKGEKTLDEEFKLHSESLHDCSGGDTTLLTQNPPQYDKWVASVYSSPAFVNGTTVLRPLSDLLVGSDAANKRSCLDDAVLTYLGQK
jgi:hypothetical protein